MANAIEISLAQKIYIVQSYYRLGEDADKVADGCWQLYGMEVGDTTVFNEIISQFETTGSVLSDFYYTVQPLSPCKDEGGIETDFVMFPDDSSQSEIELMFVEEEEEEQKYVVQEIVEEEQEEGECQEDEIVVKTEVVGRKGTGNNTVKRIAKPKSTANRSQTCKVCNETFPTDEAFRQHKQTHKVTSWVCDICGKVSLQKRVHKVHLLVHSEEKPLACPDCPMRFVRPQGLKRHQLTHTGEKPYVCEFCGQRFAAFMSHQMHVRLHTGERPYECKHCGEKFIGLPALNVSGFCFFSHTVHFD